MNPLEGRIIHFDRRNAGTRVVFNRENEAGTYGRVVLRGTGKHSEETYELGQKQFILLEHVMNHPVTNEEYASLMGNSVMTIKNTFTSLFDKFNVCCAEELVAKTLILGVCEYQPVGHGDYPILPGGIPLSEFLTSSTG